MNIRTASRLAITGVTLAMLTGCSTPAGAPAPNSATSAAIESLSLVDSWTKASETKMTAIFGVVKNDGDKDVTVSSVTTPASTAVELHETVQGETGEKIMRVANAGFVVPAHGSFELVPGGNHIMLMSLTGPIKEGDTVPLTITLSDGAQRDFVAPAKAFAGANEKYQSTTNPTH